MGDIYNIWNGACFEITLRKLCKIVFDGDDSRIPPEFAEIADEPAKEVMVNLSSQKSGVRIIFDNYHSQKASLKHITEYIKSGIVVFTPRVLKKNAEEAYPSIYAEDPVKCWIKLGQYVKNVIPMPTIGITGSSGKTTVSMFANCVFSEKYHVFCPTGKGKNLNNLTELVNQWILHVNDEYDFHIQECGGGTPQHIERQADTLNPDVFGITNIDTAQHLATYKTIDNLVQDKMSFDNVAKETAIGIVNADDPRIANYPFKHEVITFGIEDRNADCVACNIEQSNEFLEFDVVYKKRKTHLKINIVGTVNVYNALMVFLFAKIYGLSDKEIKNGFLNYHSIGIRQRLDHVGGKLLYLDCFNHAITSMMESLKTLENLKLPKEGRRIAIIGERESGTKEIYQLNYEAGKKLGDFKRIDQFIILGENKLTSDNGNESRDQAIFKGAASVMGKTKVLYFDNVNAVADILKNETKIGDAILLKGALKYYMFRIFDMAYGTSYSISYFGGRAAKHIPKETGMLKWEYISMLGGINIKSAKRRAASIINIPAMIENYNIVRIADHSFEGRHLLRRIIIGHKTRTIGKYAFRDCIFLEKIYLPVNTRYLSKGAFENCERLTLASLVGVQHVSEDAFKNCIRLRKVVFTSQCGFIAKNAFSGCQNATFFAPEGSYAAEYALNNNFKWVNVNDNYILSKLFVDGTPRYDGKYIAKKFDAYHLDKNNMKLIHQKNNLKNDEVQISVTVCGDIMTHGNQISAAFDEETGEYHFEHYFTDIMGITKQADVAICNVETTFGPGEYSGFPKFNTPDYLADAIAKAGFDVAACANNHSYDTKYAGLIRTKKTLERNGVSVSGTKENTAQKGYCVLERKGVKIAVLNYTYRTGAIKGRPTLNLNVIDEKSYQLLNTFSFETLEEDLHKIKDDIQAARTDGAGIVFVYYHWGSEYESNASIIQKYIAYKTAEAGADGIVGSHPHVMQEMEYITTKNGKKEVPVFYSLGNYIWGGLPMIKRDTVLETCLANFYFRYDKNKKCVSGVEAGHTPLKISIEYVGGAWDFGVQNLSKIANEEEKEFDYENVNTLAETKELIADILNNKSESGTIETYFDNPIEIMKGRKAAVTDANIFPNEVFKDRFVRFVSENAFVASVLQNGEIIGNNPGFTGISAFRENGDRLIFVVKVNKDENPSQVPILVNENNIIADFYRSVDMVFGKKYFLQSACKITKRTAEAWVSMRNAARKDNIDLACTINGYLTNKEQLLRIIWYSEKNGMENAQLRYMPQGCSEHHLGESIDIYSNNYTNPDSKIECFQWLLKHAYQYGFVIRKTKEDFKDINYMHARYYDNKNLAYSLYKNDMTLEEYFSKCDNNMMWPADAELNSFEKELL